MISFIRNIFRNTEVERRKREFEESLAIYEEEMRNDANNALFLEIQAATEAGEIKWTRLPSRIAYGDDSYGSRYVTFWRSRRMRLEFNDWYPGPPFNYDDRTLKISIDGAAWKHVGGGNGKSQNSWGTRVDCIKNHMGNAICAMSSERPSPRN